MSESLNRRTFLGSLAAASGAAVVKAQQPSRPNVVFFMTDDHGAWALGSKCDEMYTPNLDRLGANGVTFNEAFACTPVCSPSRATFFTGKLPSHHGVQDFLVGSDSAGPESHRFLEGHTSFADVLKGGSRQGVQEDGGPVGVEQHNHGVTVAAAVLDDVV